MSNNEQTVQYKAREYFYDLSNAALENGFKTGEHWEIHMSTADEKKALEKQYYPTVSSSVVPELITATFRLVNTFLKQSVKEQAILPVDRFEVQPVYQYLVAYSPNRVRR